MANKNAVKPVVAKRDARCNDGKQSGTVIAVSGLDVAIRWDCGTVQQLKVSELTRYHAGPLAAQKPS
jgi:hypothetical protein